jgi:hypothetical protein
MTGEYTYLLLLPYKKCCQHSFLGGAVRTLCCYHHVHSVTPHPLSEVQAEHCAVSPRALCHPSPSLGGAGRTLCCYHHVYSVTPHLLSEVQAEHSAATTMCTLSPHTLSQRCRQNTVLLSPRALCHPSPSLGGAGRTLCCYHHVHSVTPHPLSEVQAEHSVAITSCTLSPLTLSRRCRQNTVLLSPRALCHPSPLHKCGGRNLYRSHPSPSLKLTECFILLLSHPFHGCADRTLLPHLT